MDCSLYKFYPTFMERLWGGKKMRDYLPHIPLPEGAIGEAWLIADHPICESVVSEGPNAGVSLRQLMEKHQAALLGDRVVPTQTGRFPLLLKLIDAGDILSVQVHPDDAQAARLGEADQGKTEMWHVLEADPGSVLTSGLEADVTPEGFEKALHTGNVAPLMRSFPVSWGDAVFVPAGAIHAIGGGILLAEIQQNSDITYRLFDWNRVDANGAPRELHIEKALGVMDFAATHGGRAAPLRYTENNVLRETLAACRYFAAERVQIQGRGLFDTRGASFHIALALDAPLSVNSGNWSCSVRRGEAVLIPGEAGPWQVSGQGMFLDYFVPDLEADIVAPLRRHGYADAQIAMLAGLSDRNDLRAILA